MRFAWAGVQGIGGLVYGAVAVPLLLVSAMLVGIVSSSLAEEGSETMFEDFFAFVERRGRAFALGAYAAMCVYGIAFTVGLVGGIGWIVWKIAFDPE